jgi:hypothetical protein
MFRTGFAAVDRRSGMSREESRKMRNHKFLSGAVVAALAFGGVAQAGQAPTVVFVHGEGAVTDLAELADGESKVFGRGEHGLTAVREGDVVRLTRTAGGAAQPLAARCHLDTDRCEVIAREDGESIAVKIERRIECGEGAAPCALGGAPGEAHRVWVEKIVDCDGEACPESIEVLASGEPGRTLMFQGEPGAEVRVAPGDAVVLRCPEGDAHIRVPRDEAGERFFCPKHAAPMKPVEPGIVLRRVHVEASSGEAAED